METPSIKITKNHDTIKQWINDHNGTPARLGYDSTGQEGDPLTVWFRNEERDVKQTFQELDWEEFFAVFDHHNYSFKYNEKSSDNRYCEIVTV